MQAEKYATVSLEDAYVIKALWHSSELRRETTTSRILGVKTFETV